MPYNEKSKTYEPYVPTINSICDWLAFKGIIDITCKPRKHKFFSSQNQVGMVIKFAVPNVLQFNKIDFTYYVESVLESILKQNKKNISVSKDREKDMPVPMRILKFATYVPKDESDSSCRYYTLVVGWSWARYNHISTDKCPYRDEYRECGLRLLKTKCTTSQCKLSVDELRKKLKEFQSKKPTINIRHVVQTWIEKNTSLEFKGCRYIKTEHYYDPFDYLFKFVEPRSPDNPNPIENIYTVNKCLPDPYYINEIDYIYDKFKHEQIYIFTVSKDTDGNIVDIKDD